MDPLTIGLALLPSAIGGIQSIGQGSLARKIERENPRPTYQTPKEVEQALAETRALTNMGMPGGDLAMDRIGTGQANTTRALQESGQTSDQIIKGITDMDRVSQSAINSLNVAEKNWQAQAIQDYVAQLQNMGAYRDKEFQYNQAEPYENAMAASASLREASGKNLYNAAQGVANVGLMSYFDKPVGLDGETGKTNAKVDGTVKDTPIQDFLDPETQELFNKFYPDAVMDFANAYKTNT